MPKPSPNHLRWAVVCVCLAAAAGGCRNRPQAPAQQGEETALPSIEQAQEQLTPQVMALPGVVGTAIGACQDEPCIKVLVARRTPQLEEKIPPSFKGYKVVIDETGEISAPPPPRGTG